MKKLLALIAVLSMSLGCATMIPLAKDLCDTALGGSKLGKVCDQLDKLSAEEEVVEEATE